MNEFNLGNYVYGAYVNFVMGGESGGGGTNPSAQTGDFLTSVIFAVIALMLLAAAVLVLSSKIKKIDFFTKSFSKFGCMAKSLVSKKIIIALIIAASIVAVAATSFSVKAFAEENYDKPIAPAYSTATGTMDKSTNTISVSTIVINDDAVKDTGKYALIKAFSIKGLDKFASKNLGKWTVKIDDFLVYSGTINTLRPFTYITKESGVFKVDISVTDVPTDIMDELNGNLGVLVQFGNGTGSEFIEVVEKDTYPVVTVNLHNGSSVWGDAEFTIADGKEEQFNQLLNANGWIKDRDKVYVKQFDFYSDYNDILSMWNNAIAEGLLVNEHEFYKWKPYSNQYSNILVGDEEFYPEWIPQERTVSFKYSLGTDVELTAYGWKILEEKDWDLKVGESFGGDAKPKSIEGTITNLTNISEINDALSAECFNFENAIFGGWSIPDGVFFERFGTNDSFVNEAQLMPITVILSGMVIDEAGKGMPNVCVAFKPLGGERESKLQSMSQKVKALYPTVTDANGNYWLPVDKGLTGILYFGLTYFDNTDNDWSGKSLLLENVKAQNIPTIVVKEKVTLHVVKHFQDDNSNKQTLDYGKIKFVNANGEVFYQSAGVNNAEIEVYANDSGKLIYESAMYYGELDISNTSSIEDQINLYVNKKDPETDSDCLIKGVAYFYETIETKIPLPNARLKFILKDISTSERFEVEVVTNENGEYSFKGFQGVYIEQVECTTSGGEKYSSRYDVLMTYGDVFEFNATFASIGDEVE